MGSKLPANTPVKALTCGGKAVLGVDADMKLAFYVGTDGYGPDNADAVALVAASTVVKDVDLSFWGGAVIKADGGVQAWGPSTVFCNSASSISCQPSATSSAGTSVGFAMSNVPSGATALTGVSCAGKRGGHWCCAWQEGVAGTVTCFGDARGTYTPTATQLANVNTVSVQAISGGVDFIAVLSSAGELGVFGGTGEIGNGLTNVKPATVAALTMGSMRTDQTYVHVSSMNFAVFALKADGTLHAWGKSYSYSVGGGGSADMAAYTDLAAGTAAFTQLSTGNAGVYAHYCALQKAVATGVVTPVCWGGDYAGQVSGQSGVAGVSTAFLHPVMLGNGTAAAATGGTSAGTTNTGTSGTTGTTTGSTGTGTSGTVGGTASSSAATSIFRKSGGFWSTGWLTVFFAVALAEAAGIGYLERFHRSE
eukprot:CAMPEP_0178998474 /NCGR_PEP_ID=MMETSP0795-20121207/9530_1 /TAXON_ID=88552 /ORGANISM="Amoebophrya sp., Strain Ameob2" /LENGTH=421 /DNA_ID=CAMNT_0020691151 /DNA_START=244 /DNA_END=1510 /DNA_ORIENTATION=-